MRVQESTVIVLLLVIAATINALPTQSDKKIREEVEIVPLERHNPFNQQPVIDTGADFAGPFGFIENFQGLMNRMRQQMEDILKRIPFIRGNATSVEDGFPGALPGFPQIGDIDLGKGNTTSVTKVIDGHKVVINDTVYKKEDDFGGAYFKVRIIDVKPDSSEVTTDANAEEGAVSSTAAAPSSNSGEPETAENSFENEISKSSETTTRRRNNEIETYDNVDFVPTISKSQKVIIPINPEWNNLEDFNSIEETTVPTTMPRQYIDLSRDTYVNDIAVNAGAAPNPDAEVFFVPEHLRERQPQRYYNINNPR